MATATLTYPTGSISANGLLRRALALAARILPLPGRRARQATQDATVARLLQEHGNAILRLAYSYLHNMADAEDILQETLLRYMRAKPVLNGSDHERAWLLRVAANLSKNRIRDTGMHATDELSDQLAAEETEDLSFVWDAVRSLPQAQREVIHLFYQEDLPCASIAQILGRNENTVRSDLRRARNRLRQILRESYDFQE